MTDFLTSGSRKIEVARYPGKNKEYPTLIFLHEGLGCTEMWKNFPLKLSQNTGCPALVYSRLGYGRSDPYPLPWKINFMHKEALNILPDLITAVHIKKYILIGHSDGGSIGIIFAGSPSCNKGLKGLITEAAHVFCEPVTVNCIRQAKTNYEKHDLKKGLEKYHGNNTDNAFWGWNGAWLNPGFMNWNIEKYLNRIHVPMLAIQGKNDPYGSRKQIDSIQNNVPGARTCIIKDCKHSPHFDQPETTLKIMTQFIDHHTAEGCQ